jgi:dihydrofolate reductase
MFHTAAFSGNDLERTVDDDNVEAILAGNGAYIMGRNMFGPTRGEWDEQWNGWWGDNPPYKAPVFVLTHHEREPEKMEGGTTYTFVTDGIESALAQARAVAGEKNVAIAGGASTVQQFLKAGLLDELTIHISPLILGEGERLMDNIGDMTLEQVGVTFSNRATHITYRVVH